ncbi:hypothetical protein [Bdellovibrio bacteriovorus]|uniref:hypothetical protein n=1 Tax=Bdellovibrio bacteriovorus TaxID=959 RepID=UPI0035A6E43B
MLRRTIFDGIVFGFLLCLLAAALFVTSEEQLLQLGLVSSLALLFFVVGCGISLGLSARKVVTLGAKLFAAHQGLRKIALGIALSGAGSC